MSGTAESGEACAESSGGEERKVPGGCEGRDGERSLSNSDEFLSLRVRLPPKSFVIQLPRNTSLEALKEKSESCAVVARFCSWLWWLL